MSEITTIEQTSNKLVTNYDVSKFCLGDNSFIDVIVTASGADVALVQGNVLGVIAATDKAIKLSYDAADGSKYPVGACVISQTVKDGSSQTVRLVNKGKIEISKLSFETDTTIDSLVDSQAIKYHLNKMGLELISSTDLTNYDNQ